MTEHSDDCPRYRAVADLINELGLVIDGKRADIVQAALASLLVQACVIGGNISKHEALYRLAGQWDTCTDKLAELKFEARERRFDA